MPPFCYTVEDQCDLDLQPVDLEINRDHLLSIINLFAKFEKHKSNCRVIIQQTD